MAARFIPLANGSTLPKAEAGAGPLSSVLTSPVHDPNVLIIENVNNALIETEITLIGAYSSTPAPKMHFKGWTANADGNWKVDVHYKVGSAGTDMTGASTRTNDTATFAKQVGSGIWTVSELVFGTPADFSADITILFKLFRDNTVGGNLANKIALGSSGWVFEYDDGT